MDRKIIQGLRLDEERALYGLKNTLVRDCRFDGPQDGESAFKECTDIVAEDCFFNLRYPFWHVTGGVIRNCEMTELCRAALWYDRDIVIEDCKMHGIKALRECDNTEIKGCDIISPEVFWRCRGLKISDTEVQSEYPLFESRDIVIDGLKLKGKYSFQYVENMTIRNSVLDTKDAFWHSKNVTVYDSVVKGEYLGWYAENLKFVRCKISGTQPLCYCRNLILEDCTMEGTDLSFERSEVEAEIKGSIDSIKNPLRGKITAGAVGEIIMENEIVNPEDTVITCNCSGLS